MRRKQSKDVAGLVYVSIEFAMSLVARQHELYLFL